MAKYFKWHVDSIVLWVFGGVMKTDEHGTCRLYEDILVTLAGPLQHLFIFIFIILLESLNIVPVTITQIAHHYNIIILLFNLLPIYPLDGGKLMFYIASLYIPFRRAYHLTLIFSMVLPIVIIIIQILYYPFTLSAILIMSFILLENRTEWLNRMYIFRRFLLKRLENSPEQRQPNMLTVKQTDLLIHIFSQFKRGKSYIIYVSDMYPTKKLTEKQCLIPFFYEKKLVRQVRDIT